jgi:hypothetical protein
MWLKVEGFVDRVRRWWSSYQFQGSPSFILASKLKALKADLKTWNEQVFGNVESYKKISYGGVVCFDGLEEVRALIAEEKLRKSLVISELEKVTLMERLLGQMVFLWLFFKLAGMISR